MDALPGLDRHLAAVELNEQGAPQHNREFVELRALPGLGPARRAAHAGNAEPGIHVAGPARVLVDQFRWLTCGRHAGRLADQFRHPASIAHGCHPADRPPAHTGGTRGTPGRPAGREFASRGQFGQHLNCGPQKLPDLGGLVPVDILLVALALAVILGLFMWTRRSASCARTIDAPPGELDRFFWGGVMCRYVVTSGSLARLELFDWGIRICGTALARWIVPTWEARMRNWPARIWWYCDRAGSRSGSGCGRSLTPWPS